MLVFDDGLRRMTVRYLELHDDSFYYRRRYPAALKVLLGGKEWRRESLHTKDKAQAVRKLAELVARDNASWSHLKDGAASLTPHEVPKAATAVLERLGFEHGATGKRAELNHALLDDYLGSKHDASREAERCPDTGELPDIREYLDPLDHEVIRQASGKPAPKLLSDALAHYLTEHEKGHDVRFARDATRAIGIVFATIGDLPLEAYKREHSHRVRDAMLKAGLKTSSVRRRITSIAAVFAKGVKDFELNVAMHPFKGIDIKHEEKDSESLVPFSDEELIALEAAIRSHDDDMRHILGLQLNTGARLAEIVGLKVSDVALDAPVPHVVIQPHPERSLKTPQSERSVPLVGLSLWSAQRAVAASKLGAAKGSVWLFPRYAKTDSGVKADSAAGALNKWLRETLGMADRTTKCFRHALKDRMRDAAVPAAAQDAIGGWGTRTVADGYGEGYSLEKLHGHLLGTVVSSA